MATKSISSLDFQCHLDVIAKNVISHIPVVSEYTVIAVSVRQSRVGQSPTVMTTRMVGAIEAVAHFAVKVMLGFQGVKMQFKRGEGAVSGGRTILIGTPAESPPGGLPLGSATNRCNAYLLPRVSSFCLVRPLSIAPARPLVPASPIWWRPRTSDSS